MLRRCLPESRSLKSALKGCEDPLFINFIRGCLEYDPALRMTPAAALRHSWFRRRLPRPPDTDSSGVSSASTLVSVAESHLQHSHAHDGGAARVSVYKKVTTAKQSSPSQRPLPPTTPQTEQEGKGIFF